MNISEQFIEKIYQTAVTPLSEKTEEEARRCLLDFLGGALGGESLLRDKVTRYLDSIPACDGVTVIHTVRKASLEGAALLNGMMAHVFDIDDGNRLTSIHLGAPIIAALLSVAEYQDLPLSDVLCGIAAGYEAANRLGKCIQPHHRKRGFHASGTCGTIGAALGLAAMLHMGREEMKDVLSAACTSASGILEMQENRSTLKPLNIGRAAYDAVNAVLTVKAGFTGPDDPLSGKFGFLKAVADEYHTEFLTDPVPENLTVLGSYHKIHASCRHTHGAVDAVRAIFSENPGRRAEDIEGITIRMYEQGVKGHDHTLVESPVAGKMSVPFATALAAVKGSVGFSDFTEENIFDPEVQRICKASEVIVDPVLTAQAPAIREAIVTVHFPDGDLTKSVKYPKGEPEYPLTMEDMREKFSDLCACGNVPPEKQEQIAGFVLEACGASGVRELMKLL